jgi:chorismate mutase
MVVAPAAHAAPPSPLTPLVDAAAQRLLIADPVAASKWHSGGSIEDPPRVGQVLASVAAAAVADHLDADYVRRVFTDQIDATEAVEYARFSQWKLDPAAAPAAAPELAASRSTIDALNHTIVDEIAAQQNVLTSPDCGPAREEAIDAVSAARELDPLYRRALEHAARSYCPA